MPAKDLYHDTVVRALEADGWRITDDPLRLDYLDENLYIDLAAEREMIGAEKDSQQIAVEVKSFIGRSPMRDLEEALGQYHLYRSVLAEVQPMRTLYLAVPERIYATLFLGQFGQFVLDTFQIRLVVFDENLERIKKWID